jgi:hypothetical protein
MRIKSSAPRSRRLTERRKRWGAYRTGGRAGATAGADVKTETPDYEGDQTPASRPMCQSNDRANPVHIVPAYLLE